MKGRGQGRRLAPCRRPGVSLKEEQVGEEVSIRESEGTGGQSQGEQLVGVGKRSISSALYLCSRCTGVQYVF